MDYRHHQVIKHAHNTHYIHNIYINFIFSKMVLLLYSNLHNCNARDIEKSI